MAALLAWQETPQTGDLDHIDGYSMSLKNHSLVHLHLSAQRANWAEGWD